MDGGFNGSIVLVAGGTGGLGRAVAEAFLAQGAHVIVTWRHRAQFDTLFTAAGAGSPRLEGHEADVTNPAAAAALVADIVARHGRLDALVNTVGGYDGGTKLWQLDPDVLERMLALNLHAGFALARAAVPAMLLARKGSIVNVAAKAGVDPPAGAAAYAASKAAAIALIDALAADLIGTGVRVNSLLPSIIDTDANRKAMPNADYNRWPKPAEIARVILFLCSDDASVIHGASIPVYGSR
ncbi:MAG: SDR family NAD(P)-dependent oxidoreductase [Betaproteobacteria bacterium]